MWHSMSFPTHTVRNAGRNINRLDFYFSNQFENYLLWRGGNPSNVLRSDFRQLSEMRGLCNVQITASPHKIVLKCFYFIPRCNDGCGFHKTWCPREGLMILCSHRFQWGVQNSTSFSIRSSVRLRSMCCHLRRRGRKENLLLYDSGLKTSSIGEDNTVLGIWYSGWNGGLLRFNHKMFDLL